MCEVAGGKTGQGKSLERGRGHGSTAVENLCCVQEHATAGRHLSAEVPSKMFRLGEGKTGQE